MFSIAIWDDKNQRLVLIRDRIGIKPLYYFYDGSRFVFGSEIKAILASGVVPASIDRQSLDAFLTYTYIPSPMTIFTGIRQLMPGHMLIVTDGGITTNKYWQIDFSRKDNSKKEEDWISTLLPVLRNSVEEHLISDVPVAVFLSGGVDSSLLAALTSKCSGNISDAFSIGFSGSNTGLIDEVPFARQLCERYGINLREQTVTADASAILEPVVRAFDQPFADDSMIPTYYLSQITSSEVKVAISGLGGDELFGGYYRYLGLYTSQYTQTALGNLLWQVVGPVLRRIPEPKSGGDRLSHMRRFVDAAGMNDAERYYQYLASLTESQKGRLYSPQLLGAVSLEKTRSIMTSLFDATQTEDVLDRAFYVDFSTYLPDDVLTLTDRISMQHSLEVRVPFLDHRLLEAAASMPSYYKIRLFRMKHILKKIAKEFIPDPIIKHKKQGFEAPMSSWLRNELYSHAKELLSRENLERHGLFDANYVKHLLEEHASRKARHNKLIFSLMVFQVWFHSYIDNQRGHA